MNIPAAWSESQIAQYRLTGAIKIVEKMPGQRLSHSALRERIDSEREPLFEALNECVALESQRTPEARKSIQEQIGAMQALHDLRESGQSASKLIEKYRAELQVLMNASGPVPVKNSMWGHDDRVELPVEPVDRGYRLVDPMPREERRISNQHFGALEPEDVQPNAAPLTFFEARADFEEAMQHMSDEEYDVIKRMSEGEFKRLIGQIYGLG